MKTIFRPIGIILGLVLLAILILNVISLRPDPSYLVDNPQIIKLKGVERDREIRAEMDWKDFRIKLRGFSVHAEITGVFRDPDLVLTDLINPSVPTAVVDKKRLKIYHMPNSTLSCEGVGHQLNCAGRISMKIDAGFLKIKNKLSLKSQSTSELDGQQITFRHRILSGDGVPDIVIDELNKGLSEKDKTRSLPKFFIKRNVTIKDYTFNGSSDGKDLGMHFAIKMGVSDLIAAIF